MEWFNFTQIKIKTLVQIYPNKITSRIVFIIKTGYKLELWTPEKIKLLGSTKKDVDGDKDGEYVEKLESVEVVLVHCNLVKNDYHHISKVLFSFAPNKQTWIVNKYFTTFFKDDEHS